MDEQSRQGLDAIRETLSRVVRGKPDAIELLLVGLLSGGHVLLEDVPGVGKTTLAKALARCFSADFARVQFTPDLLPTDILGCQVLDPATGQFHFRAGPIFTHVLLADEINRASPRTQSALLEAMNESQVTVEGTTHELPQPFFVLATQNPVDFQGTYPLPEAQLDRFALCFGIGYPNPDQELEILFAHQEADPLTSVEPVSSLEALRRAQQGARQVMVKPDVARYMLRVVERTRGHAQIALGVSTRGSLAWFRAAQARAFLGGRGYVSPDDFQALATPVLAHRIQLGAEARYGGKTPSTLVEELIAEVVPPL
jgi:MoxR-like ATPase